MAVHHDCGLTGHFTNGHRPPYQAKTKSGKALKVSVRVWELNFGTHICLSRSELMSDTLT